MRHAKFTRDWNLRLNATQVALYRAGHSYTLIDAVAKKAEADGAIPKLFNGADPAAFDHDGDGAPGGSKPRERRSPPVERPDIPDPA